MYQEVKSVKFFKEKCSRELYLAIEYSEANFSKLEPGMYNIPGTSIYGYKIKYTAMLNADNLVYERHSNFLDLHIVVDGFDSFSFFDSDYEVKIEMVDKLNDFELTKPIKGNVNELGIGSCLCIDTGVWHAFGCYKDNETVEKFVLKIPNNILVFDE